jgi:membrane fusion protein (multidrug efflux system)
VANIAVLREAKALPTKRGLDRKRWTLSGAGVVVAIAAIAYGHRWWTVGRFIETTDDAYVGGDVTVIAPKVAGFISQVVVADNQAVHAGDLLVKLDDRDYRTVLAKTAAAVEATHATLANLDATRRLQQAMVAQAAARVAATDAETLRAGDDASRYRHLASVGATSTQELQRAEADYKKALASGQEAAAAREAAERKLEVIDAERRQTNAALAQAAAERDLAELNVGYTELRSPIDGTVGNRAARTGAFATIGSQLMSVVPARDLWVDANFKEDDLGRMLPGQAATVITDVMSGRVFHGRVASLAPGTGAIFSVIPPENATGNFTKIVQRVPVRIHLDGADPWVAELRPGLSATVRVDTRSTFPRVH